MMKWEVLVVVVVVSDDDATWVSFQKSCPLLPLHIDDRPICVWRLVVQPSAAGQGLGLRSWWWWLMGIHEKKKKNLLRIMTRMNAWNWLLLMQPWPWQQEWMTEYAVPCRSLKKRLDYHHQQRLKKKQQLSVSYFPEFGGDAGAGGSVDGDWRVVAVGQEQQSWRQRCLPTDEDVDLNAADCGSFSHKMGYEPCCYCLCCRKK